MPGLDYFIFYCFHNCLRDQNYVVFLSSISLKEKDGKGIKSIKLSNSLINSLILHLHSIFFFQLFYSFR